jgi:hypothetical protein
MHLRWENYASNTNRYWCFDLSEPLKLLMALAETRSAVQYLGTPVRYPTCLVAVLTKGSNATNASTTVRSYVKRLGGDPDLVKQGRPPDSLDILQWGLDAMHGEAAAGCEAEYAEQMSGVLQEVECPGLGARMKRLEELRREVEARWMPANRSALLKWYGDSPDAMVAYKKPHLTYQRRIDYVRLKSGEERPPWRTFELHYREVSFFNGCKKIDKNYTAGAREAYRMCTGAAAEEPAEDQARCDTCGCEVLETRKECRLLPSSASRLREIKDLRTALICRSPAELGATLCCEEALLGNLKNSCRRCTVLLRVFDESLGPDEYAAMELRMKELSKESEEGGLVVTRTCRCGTVEIEEATSRRRRREEEGCRDCGQLTFVTEAGQQMSRLELGSKEARCMWISCGCGRRRLE